MRLFVALALPVDVITELAAAQQHLQRGVNHPVRWVAPEAIHLTLQFLGDVAEERVPAILTALKESAPARSVHLQLACAGAFPHLRRPQTIWMGIAGNVAGLEQMQRIVTTALQPLGFPPEDRPFRAHLTLGRVRREATPDQRMALGSSIGNLPVPRPVAWHSGRPILYQSILSPHGATYQALGPE